MIDAVIVDDMNDARAMLHSMIQDADPEINVVGEAQNIQEAWDVINNLKPQVIFLDIEMPGGNGFDLLRKFDRIWFETIFVTSYDNYAIRAIKYSALDYLLKPVDPEDLVIACGKLKQKIENKSRSYYDVLLEHLGSRTNTSRIVLPGIRKDIIVDANDIIWCEADGGYTNYHISGKGKLMVSYPLKETGEILSDFHFIRIHKSYIINPGYVVGIEKHAGGHVIMNDNEKTRLPISRRKKDEVLKAIKSSGKNYS